MTHRIPFRRLGAVAALAMAFAVLTAPLHAAVEGEESSGTESRQAGRSFAGNYLAGRHAQTVQDLDAAALYLGAALEVAPDDADLLRRTFIVLVAGGRVDESVPLGERLIAARPDDTVAFLTLAVDAVRSGDYDAAVAYMTTSDDSGIATYFQPLISAWAAFGKGDTPGALAALQPLSGSSATQALYEAHAAMISAAAGDTQAAIGHFVTVTELQGGLALRNTEHLGTLYEVSGEPRKAEALYRSFLDQYPGSRLMQGPLARLGSDSKPSLLVTSPAEGVAEGLFGVASSLNQQNAPETALILAQLARYLRPDFPALQLMIGNLMESLYGASYANAVYRGIDPSSDYAWSARLRLAANLADMGEIAEAEKLYREMAAEDPAAEDPLIDLGDLMRVESRFDEAVAAYDAAFERIGDAEERHWSLYYARGIALERAKQWDRAEADFLKALEYEPDQPLVLNYLGYSWVEMGRELKRAEDMIRKAVSLRPNDGYIVDSLGWVYYKLGRYKEAVRELERAVELRAEDPVINEHLGDAYWKVGRTREARFQWRRALSLDPEPDLVPVIETKLQSGLDADGG